MRTGTDNIKFRFTGGRGFSSLAVLRLLVVNDSMCHSVIYTIGEAKPKSQLPPLILTG